MGAKTVNELVGMISVRVRELADKPMDWLRLAYPETTETPAQLIRLCKQQGLTRGQLIEAIIVEDFLEDFDRAIEEA
jgi:hypothetical protein